MPEYVVPPIGTRIRNPIFGDGTVRTSSFLVEFDIRNTRLHDGGTVSSDFRCWYFVEDPEEWEGETDIWEVIPTPRVRQPSKFGLFLQKHNL